MDNEKMHVCFIIGTLERGGAEKQLVFMLRALKSCSFEVTALCLTKGEELQNEIEELGIPVKWIGRSGRRGIRQIAIINEIRKSNPDLIQSSHFYTNIYAGIAGKVLRIPSIGAIRNDLVSEISIHGFLGRWQVALPDFLIVNSKLAYERTIEKGIPQERIALVCNVVEMDPQVRINRNKPCVDFLFVGRLHEDKQPENFVKLAAELLKAFPDSTPRFRMVGEGHLKESLQKMTEELKLDADKFEILGFQSDMNAIYGKSDVLVSTSIREGTPNVILEAMANGLPVIATNVGGTPQIVSKDTGTLIRPDDLDQLKKAAVNLLENRNLRREMGAKGKEFVEKHHSLDALSKQLPAVYEKWAN